MKISYFFGLLLFLLLMNERDDALELFIETRWGLCPSERLALSSSFFTCLILPYFVCRRLLPLREGLEPRFRV